MGNTSIYVRAAVLAVALLVAGTSGARAQDAPAEGRPVFDRVVAIVGDSAIFMNEILEDVERRRLQGAQVPAPQDSVALHEFRGLVLQEFVDRTLLLNAAAEDTTVVISEQRIDDEFQRNWEGRVQEFGSEEDLQLAIEAEGFTLAQYRNRLRAEIHRGLLLESYVQAQRQTSRVTPVEEADMRAFFERERATLPPRPATLTFEQVVIAPTASDSIRAEARAEAERILGLLREGEDFAELARRFSDDPGSGSLGGDLGWVRRGIFVEEFEEAAFSLGREQISDVVDTDFGSHIIQVQRINGGERLVRHILIAAEAGEADVDRAIARAQEIIEAVRNGTPISEFEDEGEDIGLSNPVELSRDQLSQLPSGLANGLAIASVGEVLGPIEVQGQGGQPAFAVVRLTAIREAGELTYEDVREQIRAELENRQFRDELLERLRSESFVEVRW